MEVGLAGAENPEYVSLSAAKLETTPDPRGTKQNQNASRDVGLAGQRSAQVEKMNPNPTRPVTIGPEPNPNPSVILKFNPNPTRPVDSEP